MSEQSETQREVRERDVFSFRYNKTECAKLIDPYHCFDGQLIALSTSGGFVLYDSYWLNCFSLRGDDTGRKFTLSEAHRLGELNFLCNLNDVREIHKSETRYFSDDDVWNLSYQHNSYAHYVVRNGAERDKEKMLAVLESEEQEQVSRIRLANNTIERVHDARRLIAEGRIDEVLLP